jgi:hypothetical protein
MERLPYLLTVIFTVLLLFLLNSISQAQTSFNISNKTSGDTLLTIDNEGHVGIHTTSGVGLNINSQGNDLGTAISLNNADGSHYLYMYSGRDGSPGLSPVMIWQEGDPMRFGSWGAQYNEYMRITLEGNVGIGTDSVFAKLHIEDEDLNLQRADVGEEIVTIEDFDAGLGLYSNGNGSFGSFFNMGEIISSSLSNKWSLYRTTSNATVANQLRFSFGSDAGYWLNPTFLALSNNGNIGIGTTSPTERLEVAGTIYSNSGGFRFPDGTTQTTAATGGANNNTLDQAYDQGGAGAGRTIIADAGAVNISGNDGLTVNGNIGIGTTSTTYPLEIYPGTDNRGINIDHNQSGTGTTHAIYVDIDKTSIGTSDIYGMGLQVTNDNGSGSTYGLLADVDGTSDGFKYGIRGMAGGEGWKYGVYGFATGTGNKFGIFGAATGSGTNWAGYFGDGNVHISNRLGIGTLTPGAGLHVSGNGFPNSFLYLESVTGTDAGIRFYEETTPKWSIYNNSTEGGFQIQNNAWETVLFADQSTANVGIRTTNPTSTLTVAGTVECDVLEINGGADIAEPFDIYNTMGIEAGMVMAIDSDNPGKIKISEKAYDRCVVGIISGAGGIDPGMIMGQSGTIADGEFPVALTGRVYCRVDASNGYIHPGDLLTTSKIPGHAMKVTDYTKAQGAVIGKAMSSLENEQGLILVLVSLQ